MSASDVGGAYYSIGILFNALWEKDIPNVLTTVLPGGSVSNVKSLLNGESDVGWTHSTDILLAKKALPPYDKVYEGITQVLATHPATLQCIVVADSKIASLSEVGDKKIGLGTSGSLGNIAVMALLDEEYGGITEKSITANGGTISYLSQPEAGAALQDGQIDIWLGLGPYPWTSLVSEVSNNPGIRLVEIEPDILQRFLTNHPEYSSQVVPSGTYKGLDNDYDTFATWNILAVKEDMDTDLVYQMTKSIWDNIDYVYDGSATAKSFMKKENACMGWQVTGIHPGAKKYYDEVGITFK